MQLCQHCGHENLEGVVFCEKCGVGLVPVALATRQLMDDDDASLGGTDRLGVEGVLILQVGHNTAPILVQMRDEMILGRRSGPPDDATYIDLTSYGADEQGVSRQHARLLRDDRAVYLMDLNSTNGTRLNGEPLPDAVERRLHDGDEITLGRLQLYVYFKT